MILRRIVAGSEIDGAIELAALNFVGDGGGRSECLAEQSLDAMLLKNLDGERREFFGVETGIVADKDGRVGFLLVRCSEMARTARRTVAKVKSSAMIPRQPEVPNLMGEVAMVGIFYLVPRVSCRVGDKEMGGSGMEKAAEFRDGAGHVWVDERGAEDCNGGCGKKVGGLREHCRWTVESIYWWKGKVETGRERLLILKTAKGKLKKLEAEVRRLHSYEVPEFLVVGVEGGAKEYLECGMLEVRVKKKVDLSQRTQRPDAEGSRQWKHEEHSPFGYGQGKQE